MIDTILFIKPGCFVDFFIKLRVVFDCSSILTCLLNVYVLSEDDVSLFWINCFICNPKCDVCLSFIIGLIQMLEDIDLGIHGVSEYQFWHEATTIWASQTHGGNIGVRIFEHSYIWQCVHDSLVWRLNVSSIAQYKR